MEIAPFSSVKLEVIWQPTVPGKVETEFIVAFTDPDSESVSAEETCRPLCLNRPLPNCLGLHYYVHCLTITMCAFVC